MQTKNKWWIGLLGVGAVVGASVCKADVDALTKAKYDLKIGFNVAGVVLNVQIKEGQVVKKGDKLIELDDRPGEVTVALYKLHADNDIDIRSYEKKEELAKEEKEQQEYLLHKAATDLWSVKKAEIQYEVSKLDTAAAKEQRQESLLQYQKMKVTHDQYTLLAPHDGKIETVLVHEGEVVEANKPILRLVATDPLWVDAPVPFEDTLKLKPGDTAWVRSKIAGRDQPIAGTITWIAEVSDAASDTRTVRVEFANPDGRPAGEHMDVSFTPFKNLASAATQEPSGDRQ